MGHRTLLILLGIGLVCLATFIGYRLPTPQDVYEPGPPGSVTWRGNVAAILHSHCAECHRPGQSGPFDLLTFGDAVAHAKQIAKVTRERIMPPWLPVHGADLYANARRLSTEEIGLLGQWAADGAPEGEGAEPNPPSFHSGWQMGEPDLVVSMPRPYLLPAEGRDVYRNFIIPVPLKKARWVEAFEIRPSNPRVVHHAIMFLNDGQARALDAADRHPGFDGMELAPGGSRPDGHFLSWQPGRAPLPEIPGAGWQLPAGSDLLLQVHMQPTGKPETVELAVGFRFTDTPPHRRPVLLGFMHSGIHIPAGEADYQIRLDYTLPMAVHAYGVLPHLHYLGKRVQGYATLPDGSVQTLLDIPQWDFNWQSEYRFREPLALPAGTVVTQHYSYDNSAANPRNPHHPPQLVRYGPETTDEMGEMWLQVIPDFPRRAEELQQHNRMWNLQKIVGFKAALLAADPSDIQSAIQLAKGQFILGNHRAALPAFERVLALDPEHYVALFYLGKLHSERQDLTKALAFLERAAAIRADEAQMHNLMGDVRRRMGDLAGASSAFAYAIRIDPSFSQGYYNLGITLFQLGKVAQAEAMLSKAVELTPDNAQAWADLGGVRANMQQFDSAVQALERALALDPSHNNAANNLRMLRQIQARP